MVLEALDNCRVCNAQLNLIENMPQIPLDGSRLEKNINKPEYYDSALYLCPECGLYQMPDIKDFFDFYDFSNTKFIKSLNDERKEMFDEFLLLSGSRESILGIEAVDFIQTAGAYYQNSTVINPEILCREGAAEGASIENFAWGDAGKESLDAVYIICPFAHFPKPLKVMKDIFKMLKDGGTGWIEVLNGGALIEKGYYFNFMPILLNYWTPHSLSALLRLAGLETLSIQPGLGGDQLNVFFKKPEKRPSLMKKREKQAQAILSETAKYKNVIIWGAGAKAHYLFGYLSEKLSVSHIVDSSPAKLGLFMPGAQVAVEEPTAEIFKTADLVIIFAASYKKEITEKLRTQYNYSGKIFCLSEN